jgi:hypothetical protein
MRRRLSLVAVAVIVVGICVRLAGVLDAVPESWSEY